MSIFPQNIYKSLPLNGSSSRPVSAQRPASQLSEAISSNNFMIPHGLEEARIRLRSTTFEMVGYSIFTCLLLAFALSAFIVWLTTYAVPFSTYLAAQCLVLNSTQLSKPEGFMREPLYRAEVYVYVFNTTYPECCCPNAFGQSRCAEWEAVSFDNIIESYTSGDKTDFLIEYGYPGTYHFCWHSPAKDKVVLVRSLYAEFLMAPGLSLLLGLLGIRYTLIRVQRYKESRYFYDLYSGNLSNEQKDDVNQKVDFRKPYIEEDEELDEGVT